MPPAPPSGSTAAAAASAAASGLWGREKWRLSSGGSKFWTGASGCAPAWPQRLARLDSVRLSGGGEGGGGCGGGWGGSHPLIQSQGDSRRVRSPLDSNLGEAVEESQHGRGHAGAACRRRRRKR